MAVIFSDQLQTASAVVQAARTQVFRQRQASRLYHDGLTILHNPQPSRRVLV
jgi:hypothetical protein